jgi:DNA polymerase, archaea type
MISRSERSRQLGAAQAAAAPVQGFLGQDGGSLPGSAGEPARAHRLVLSAYEQGGDLMVVEQLPTGLPTTRRAALEHVAFFDAADVAPDLEHALKHSRHVRALRREGRWVRVTLRDGNTRRDFCRWAFERGLATYEGDVSAVRRFMTDHDVKIGRPRRSALDLETDPRPGFQRKEEMRLLCWTLGDWQTGGLAGGMLDDWTDDAERRLIAALLERLERFDQVLAWNGDRFDFPVLAARAARYSLRIPRRLLLLDMLPLFKRMNMAASKSGDEKQSYALGNIAQAILGEGKDEFDARQSFEFWQRGGEDRRRLGRYCEKDNRLLHRLEQKTGYVELHHTLCEVSGVFPDSRGVNPSLQVEAFMLQLARDRDYKFKTRTDRVKGPKYKGAFVLKPKLKGVLRNVHVADFSSMYPSIIISWNMSPEAKIDGALPAVATGSPLMPHSTAPITGVQFRTDVQGMLPLAVAELLRLRKYWSKLQASYPPGTPEHIEAERRSIAYKISANSFYGVIGMPLSTYFDREVAESITQAGVHLIQETIKAAEARGFVVVYADTDGMYAMGCTEEEFAEFTAWCNAVLYPGILSQHGCGTTRVEAAFEKSYDRIVFTAAKKYAGRLLHYKGERATEKTKPEVKGLEWKRGDGARLAREMQGECIQLLMRDCNDDPLAYEGVLNRWMNRVLNEPLTLDEVVVSQTMKKPLKGYAVQIKKDGTAKKQPPHVEIAKVLIERGRDADEGAKIDYYLHDASSKPAVYKPAEDWAGDADPYGFWDQVVVKPTLRLLQSAFPARDWSLWKRSRPKKPRAKKKEHAA